MTSFLFYSPPVDRNLSGNIVNNLRNPTKLSQEFHVGLSSHLRVRESVNSEVKRREALAISMKA